MDATNPYQPTGPDPRHRRRSLVILISAALGSIMALIVLNTVARPSRAGPALEIEYAPAAALLDETTTTTVPALPVATLNTAPSTNAAASRWIPPDTPDFVRAALLDDESLDVVAPFADGEMAYFLVSPRGSTDCGGTVYRIERGHGRELVSSARYLFPRGDGRWIVLATNDGADCRPGTLTIIDTTNDTARELPAAGWFARWSTADARFVLYDYVLGQFTVYDASSATSVRLVVSPSFASELDARIGGRPTDHPGWIMGHVAFLATGELVAHIQCQPDACPKKDPITGWFYLDGGQVTGESARVPADKAPPFSGYCSL